MVFHGITLRDYGDVPIISRPLENVVTTASRKEINMRARFLTVFFVMTLVLLPNFCLAQGQADIAVTDIGVDADCFLRITFKNVGNTQLPATATDQYYGAYVKIMHNGANAGAWRFGAAVKMPGSVATQRDGVISGTVNVTATYMTNDTYVDTNPANNSMSKTLTCTRAMADLTITAVDFASDCRPVIKLKNLGNAAMSDTYYNGAYLQRRMDNVPAGQLYLRTISADGRIKAVQGTAEYTDGKEYLPQSTLRYDIVSNIALQDSNANNNSVTVNVPDRCKGGAIKRIVPPVRAPIQSPAPITPVKPLRP